MRADLRAPVLGLAAWSGALAAFLLPGRVLAGALALGLVGVVRRWRRGRPVVTRAAWLLATAAVAGSALLRAESVAHTPVERLAAERAVVRGVLVVRSDPVLESEAGPGPRSGYVRFRALILEIEGRGHRFRLRTPVLVFAGTDWSGVRLGSRLRFSGRLDQTDDRDLAAVLATRGPPRIVAGPSPLLRGAEQVRAGIRDAVSGHDPGPRALVPALVDGDDGRLPDDTEADFRTTGLTHLLAVSGTNLTLIVGFLLAVARWCRVRARGLVVVGVLGVVGFVLLARTEPSVLRAAVMGSVGLVAMGLRAGQRGRERGLRTLGVAVLGLLLIDPWLARSPGFVLSVCATAGIVLFAGPWRDALARWLPRWLAEAVAVPLAAQLACTPAVAALSGQVSLVAVAANLAVAWAVGPATVLGLVGGLADLVAPALGHLVATPAVWCAAWVIAVARTGADLPVAAIGWSSTWWSVGLLGAACAAIALRLEAALVRRGLVVGLSGLLAVTLLVPLPTRGWPWTGWPPDHWVMVACDVGQGDALVLNAGAGSAVVVDVGPDPQAVDRCLDRLGVRAVPLVVLTHFHADHVDGLPGALRGRRVGEIATSSLPEPASGARLVGEWAGRAGVPVREVTYAESTAVGPLAWQVLGPARTSYPDSGSPPNDASVVLLVEVRGVRLLLLGDQEEPAQHDLARLGGLRADVVKVAHHGSSKQDERLLAGLGARLAVVSVGAGNDYGHPADSALRLLDRAGLRVLRTDLLGDVAVVVDERGRLATATRRSGSRARAGTVGGP